MGLWLANPKASASSILLHDAPSKRLREHMGVLGTVVVTMPTLGHERTKPKRFTTAPTCQPKKRGVTELVSPDLRSDRLAFWRCGSCTRLCEPVEVHTFIRVHLACVLMCVRVCLNQD